MADILFKPLYNFDVIIGGWREEFSDDKHHGYIKDILSHLIDVNQGTSDQGTSEPLRKKVKNCYEKIIPLGFKLFGLSPQMANQMERDFDQWTAIPHFDKFEIDLVESYYTRDHYLHPLCVFATGVYALNHLHQKGMISVGNIVRMFPYWLFCSLLHDLGYVIERYSDILDVFFSKFLMVKYRATFDFKDVMFNGNYHRNLKCFNDELEIFLSKCATNKDFTRHKTDAIVNNVLYAENDHGLISALSAYERLDNVIAKFDELISEAKFLRDADNNDLIADLEKKWDKEAEYNRFKKAYFRNNYFKYIKGDRLNSPIIKIRKDFESIKKKFKKIVLAIGLHNKLAIKFYNNGYDIKIGFRKNPLVFLLLYCDAIQDWGRSKQQNKEIKLLKIKLNTRGKLVAKYKTQNPQNENLLGKIAELDRTSNFLNADGFFQIVIPPYNPFNI